MVNNILFFGIPGTVEWLIILFIFVILDVLIILIVRLLLRNKRENVRLRLEVGKLADELEQMRKKKDDEDKDSSDKSG
jgi:hypothetical protein